MRSRANMACVLKIALAALCAAPPAGALDITLPAETASFKASNLPGYPLVQQNCLDQFADVLTRCTKRGHVDAKH